MAIQKKQGARKRKPTQYIIEFAEENIIPPYRPLIFGEYKDKNLFIIFGSRNSAKSHFVAQKIILDALTKPNYRCLLVRKVLDTVRGSQYQKIIDLIEQYQLDKIMVDGVPLVKFSKAQNAPIFMQFYNGNSIIGKGLDKSTKIKSLSDPTAVWYEEAEEISRDEFNAVSLSLRSSNPDVILQEYIVFNPPKSGEDFWVIKDYFSDDWKIHERADGMHTIMPTKDDEIIRKNTVIIHTCFKHNPFLDNTSLEKFQVMERRTPDEFLRGGLGLIRKSLKGNLFYNTFNLKKHIAENPIPYDPQKPIHITWDFNINPYQTCLVIQLEQVNENHWKVKIIDEVLGKYPHNTPRATALLFAKKYKGHRSTIFVYGDPAGAANDKNYFKIIKNTLSTPAHDQVQLRSVGQQHEINQFTVDIRANTKQYGVAERRMFITELMAGGAAGGLFLEISVSPNCTELMRDFEFLEEDVNGGKWKRKVKDSNGNAYEELGHTSDALDYFICKAFLQHYDAFRKAY